ncbi:MAG: TPM domain-containing protein, partial [Clostridia bacterium]|nr:TPM domain-containing protein [Clostridia bacterium]
MKRTFLKWSALCVALFLCLTLSVSAHPVRMVDEANLLTEQQAAELSAKLDEISKRLDFDVVVVTTSTLDYEDMAWYADEYYSRNGYGLGDRRSGVLLLINMSADPDERGWFISTAGEGINVINDNVIDNYFANRFVGKLSSGRFYEAFWAFADSVETVVTAARGGEATDSDGDVINQTEWNELSQRQFSLKSLLISIGISLGAGLLIALIVVNRMKGKLKTVRFQSAANNYLREGSMQLLQSDDQFLYAHVDRTAKPQNNSSGGTRTDSSGMS